MQKPEKLSLVFMLFSFLLLGYSNTYSQQSHINSEKYLKNHWQNKQGQKASVYYFSFCIPGSYLNHNHKKLYNALLSRKAKFVVFKILEDKLSQALGQKVVVIDPVLAAQETERVMSANATCQYGFKNFPGWTLSNFRKYITKQQYYIKVAVAITGNIHPFQPLSANNFSPTCSISIKIYNNRQKIIRRYKYKKANFKGVNKLSLTPKYDKALGDIPLSHGNGLKISVKDVVSIFARTLQEMLAETKIQIK